MNIPDMTPGQKDAFYGYFKHRDFRRNPDGSLVRVMGGGYKRKMDTLEERKLIYRYDRNGEKRGKPKEINTRAPSALGIRAWQMHDPRAREFPGLNDLIGQLEKAEIAWHEAEETRKAAERQSEEERRARARVKLVESCRAAFFKIGFDVTSLDDDAVIDKARIVEHAYSWQP